MEKEGGNVYSETKIRVRYFKSERQEKSYYGKVSETIRVGEEQGKPVYAYETWDAWFWGDAKEKFSQLKNKQSIVLTKWACRVTYDKEKKRQYPYMVILDFEIL